MSSTRFDIIIARYTHRTCARLPVVARTNQPTNAKRHRVAYILMRRRRRRRRRCGEAHSTCDTQYDVRERCALCVVRCVHGYLCLSARKFTTNARSRFSHSPSRVCVVRRRCRRSLCARLTKRCRVRASTYSTQHRMEKKMQTHSQQCLRWRVRA